MFFYFSELSKSFQNFLVVFSNSVSRVLFENGHNFFIGSKLSEFSGFEKKLVLKSYDPVGGGTLGREETHGRRRRPKKTMQPTCWLDSIEKKIV